MVILDKYNVNIVYTIYTQHINQTQVGKLMAHSSKIIIDAKKHLSIIGEKIESQIQFGFIDKAIIESFIEKERGDKSLDLSNYLTEFNINNYMARFLSISAIMFVVLFLLSRDFLILPSIPFVIAAAFMLWRRKKISDELSVFSRLSDVKMAFFNAMKVIHSENKIPSYNKSYVIPLFMKYMQGSRLSSDKTDMVIHHLSGKDFINLFLELSAASGAENDKEICAIYEFSELLGINFDDSFIIQDRYEDEELHVVKHHNTNQKVKSQTRKEPVISIADNSRGLNIVSDTETPVHTVKNDAEIFSESVQKTMKTLPSVEINKTASTDVASPIIVAATIAAQSINAEPDFVDNSEAFDPDSEPTSLSDEESETPIEDDSNKSWDDDLPI